MPPELSPISEDDALSAVDAMSRLLGLPILPEHRDGVALNLARLMAQARLVQSVALPEETEPASVFTP
jgi:hypothetical protein